MVYIYIDHANIWYKTRKRMKKFLGEYYTENPRNAAIIVNFGSCRYSDDEKIIINKDTLYMRDKILMNKKMDELNIPHPPTYYFPFYDIPNISGCQFIIKERNSQMGKNIKIKKLDEIKNLYIGEDRFVQFFVPFERQFRVVVDFLGTFGVKEKLPKYDGVKIYNQKSCKFRLRYGMTKLEEFCHNISKKMGFDFAGYDIGEFKGKYYVIEINSAPALHNSFAKPFAEHLIGLLYR